MEVFDAKDWKYRAEGNKHIVVCNEKSRVLRLQKKSPFIPNGGVSVEKSDEDEDNVTDVLKFQEYIALPLLRNSDSCHVARQVLLSEEFIRALSSKIESQRPESRKHKHLQQASKGILMFDYCFISKEAIGNVLKQIDSVSVDTDTLSIEIKPKLGFILPSQEEKVCQFCKTQLYRVQHEKRFADCSYYCPLDLFSGEAPRMRKAVQGLLNNPQNNFRIFKNGKLVYGHELLRKNGIRSSPNRKGSLAKSILNQLLLPFVGNSDTVLSGNVVTSVLIDVICEALLLPIVKKVKSSLEIMNNVCQGISYKNRFSRQSIIGQVESENHNTSRNLPNNSILALILATQKLNSHSICEIKDFYENVKESGFSDCSDVDAPYNSIGWNQFLQQLHGEETSSAFNDDATTKIRRFLVSKSFSDCSIMLTFRKLHCDGDIPDLINQQPTALCNLIHDRLGNSYVASIGVVDLDPKHSSKIPTYYRYGQKLSDWWKTVQYHDKMT